MRYCFGIDVGGTTIKCGLFKENGELLESWSIPTRVGSNGALIYDDVAQTVRAKMTERGIPDSDVAGVGMDMPGPVYEDGRFGFGNNIATYGGYPAKEVSMRLGGMKTALANDANAAALGELWMGAGKGRDNLVMVTLGTGVGGGIVRNGALICGMHGAAGEIGHVCVEPAEKEQCNCGAYGCTEQYASATGIVRLAKRLLQSGDPGKIYDPETSLKNTDNPMAALVDSLTAKDVCDQAKEGNELAVKTLDIAMDYLGKALSYVVLTVDPQVFVIGGGVAKAGEVILSKIRRAINKYTPLLKEEERAEVIAAKLGNDAGIYGAAALVILNAR